MGKSFPTCGKVTGLEPWTTRLFFIQIHLLWTAPGIFLVRAFPGQLICIYSAPTAERPVHKAAEKVGDDSVFPPRCTVPWWGTDKDGHRHTRFARLPENKVWALGRNLYLCKLGKGRHFKESMVPSGKQNLAIQYFPKWAKHLSVNQHIRAY